MKNAYSILCEFLDRLMTEDNHLSFLVYKQGDEYRLKLVYPENEKSNRRYTHQKEQIELDNEYYLEDLEDPYITMQRKNIKWIEKQIPGFSWSDFQNSKKLKQFVK